MNLLLPGIAAAFLLTFARVGTLVMLLPGVGEQLVSPRLRLAFALLLTLVLFPTVRPLLPMQGEAIAGPGLIALLFGEVLVGLVLGLSVRMVLAALQVAGVVMSQQLGLSYAMTVDPTQGGQQTALGNFLALLGVTLIVATDLHHIALAAIGRSYVLLPPDGVPGFGEAAALALKAIARGFALGVQISAPFIAFGILFNVGLGVLARLMPQMQVFFVAVPASVLIGMLVLLGSLGVMMGVFLDDIGRYLADLAGR
ncbi:flagellar biosynthetic protein FliR [Methylobacterium sp. Leaf469]|jgi:flagellar biosynthetic protein FliR|uniref:flagellar biosynthetic protein FliR n=1 Tax=unclassified Methylobacterium TaxID=2615210 RepID=UPI0006F45E03|nr:MULTISPECIES: flagellar biosynthetic protein FliR [unclassified Methylobacterium]USU32818.1 flagellar type III secretion system protein FliR [Methylobacterium sp. OTU13CASTA1]KQO69082.1 flagellar biosynthetic protein FliR [Methylobacterium sp. Leaf87]KQP30715.1 flagellar biosynthetic protein FliR [Methylobacterium sp. Leaf102]KQP67633.1 flagellar biosynthetic protein FliR [Methylobacterium sp. Leaf112]KQT98786.1 flagellar biosynthetic protein FliR [Methylobacterium sp. Leaf469]